MTAGTADRAELLADAAASALVAFRAAEESAAAAVEAARRVRLDTLLALSQAGWSVRRIAAELDLSPARVGQLLQDARRVREAEWSEDIVLRPINTKQQQEQEYRLARYSWERAAETFAHSTPGKAGQENSDLEVFRELSPAPTWGQWLAHR